MRHPIILGLLRASLMVAALCPLQAAHALTLQCEATEAQLAFIFREANSTAEGQPGQTYTVQVHALNSGDHFSFELGGETYLRWAVPARYLNPRSAERFAVEIPNYYEGGASFRGACDWVPSGSLPVPSAPEAEGDEQEGGRWPQPSAPSWEDLQNEQPGARLLNPPGGPALSAEDDDEQPGAPRASSAQAEAHWQAARLAEARRLRELTEREIAEEAAAASRPAAEPPQQEEMTSRLRRLEAEARELQQRQARMEREQQQRQARINREQQQRQERINREQQLRQERINREQRQRQEQINREQQQRQAQAERERLQRQAAEELLRLERERLQRLATERVTAHGNNQGQLAAERIAQLYGPRENFTFNLAKGIARGIDYFDSRDEGEQAYREGRAAGVIDGQEKAGRYARESARRKADNLAKVEARARHRAAVETGRVDRRLIIPSVRLDAGRVSSYFTLRTELARQIDAMNNEFHREAANLWDDIASLPMTVRPAAGEELPSLLTLFDKHGHYQVNKERYLPSFAYEQWAQGRLGAGFDKGQFDTYDQREKGIFAQAFKREYEANGPAKMQRVVDADNRLAYQAGMEWGGKIKIAETRLRGYEAGLAEGLVSDPATFLAEFAPLYAERFEHWLRYWDATPEVEGRFKLVKAEARDLSFSLVGEFVNFGGGAAAGGQLQVLSKHAELAQGDEIASLAGHSRVKFELGGLLRVTSEVRPGKRFKVDLLLPFGGRQTIEYTLTFEDMLAQWLTASAGSQTRELLHKSICGTIGEEWYAKSWIYADDIYQRAQQDPQASLLKRLVVFSQENTGDYKAIHDTLYGYSKDWWSFWLHRNKRASFRQILQALPH